MVLNACAAEELWVAGRDGGVRQPIERGDNAGDLTADISPGGDKPLAMIVAHEGGTRFTPGDGEILRVGAREIAAAIKRESASMEMENSAMWVSLRHKRHDSVVVSWWMTADALLPCSFDLAQGVGAGFRPWLRCYSATAVIIWRSKRIRR